MALADTSHFDRLVNFLKQKRENVTFHDIISLAEIAAQSAWLLILVGAAVVVMAWATLAGNLASRQSRPAASPAWLVLALVMLVGWFMPADAADWLRVVAEGAR